MLGVIVATGRTLSFVTSFTSLFLFTNAAHLNFWTIVFFFLIFLIDSHLIRVIILHQFPCLLNERTMTTALFDLAKLLLSELLLLGLVLCFVFFSFLLLLHKLLLLTISLIFFLLRFSHLFFLFGFFRRNLLLLVRETGLLFGDPVAFVTLALRFICVLL